MPKFIVRPGNDPMSQLCVALGLEPSNVRRVVLDLNVGSPCMAYVEMYGDDERLTVALTGGLAVQLVDGAEEAGS